MDLRNSFLMAAFLAASAITAQAGPVTITDSTADYSGTEGTNSWQYGFFVAPGTTFQTTGFTYGDTISGWWATGNTGLSNYAFLGPGSMAHPGLFPANGSASQVNYDVVRRYTDSYTGLTTISGSLFKQDTSAPYSQVLTGTIYLNGVSVYNGTVHGNDGTGLTYSFNQNLTAGDVLDFALSAGTASSIQNDLSLFSGKIQTANIATPEPTTFVLGAGLIGLSFLLRRKSVSIS